MIGFFKFVPTKYTGDFLAGKLRFGSASWYRLLESLGNDHCVGDLTENSAVNLVNVEIENEELKETDKQALRKVGINIGDNVSDCSLPFRMISCDNCYIFSFSRGCLRRLQQSFNGRGWGDSEAIYIQDIEQLQQALLNTGRLLDGAGEGIALADAVSAVDFCQVQYGTVTGDVMQGRIISPDPRRKPLESIRDHCLT